MPKSSKRANQDERGWFKYNMKLWFHRCNKILENKNANKWIFQTSKSPRAPSVMEEGWGEGSGLSQVALMYKNEYNAKIFQTSKSPREKRGEGSGLSQVARGAGSFSFDKCSSSPTLYMLVHNTENYLNTTQQYFL